MKNKVLAISLVGAMAFSLAACGNSSSSSSASKSTSSASSASSKSSSTASTSSESDMQYVIDKGTLVVGITNFEPMDYMDEDGNWVGFDADLATAFADSLGVDVEFMEIDWNNKILELDGKTIDCVWNGMTLTDDVKASMETSKPYCTNAQVIVVPADKAEQYATAEACKELSFAVENGSAGKDMAVENGFKYTEVSAQSDAVAEVASGTSDAAIIDLLMAGAMVGEGTGFAKLTYTAKLNSEDYGVGFRKGSDLAAALNDFFAASLADGSMEKVAEQYGVQESLIK